MLLTLHAHGQAEENTAKAPAPGEAPVIGQPFPQLRLPTLDGKATIDTADLKGRRVLLIEFASW